MTGAPLRPVFTGVAVALVTFFDEHGHVDVAATARHAERLAGRGMRALVVAGSTVVGETVFPNVGLAIGPHSPLASGFRRLQVGTKSPLASIQVLVVFEVKCPIPAGL